MSLFPKCSFHYYLDKGARLVPGQRNAGRLVLDVPEEITRAEHLVLVLKSQAWAGYGSGKNRRVVRNELLRLPLRVDIPSGGMPVGKHEYPFHFDLPDWLPPAFEGYDCGIVHELEATLDVDWAIDPVSRVNPRVAMLPTHGRRLPSVVRSPNGFHEAIVLEITLDSAVIAEDEPLSGKIALRAGADARMDAVVLTFCRITTVAMGHGDRRKSEVGVVRLTPAMLHSGEPIPFLFPPDENGVPSFGGPQLVVDHVLRVSVDVPWSFDPEMEVPFTILPKGSSIEGEGSAVAVGGERLRQMAGYLAQRTGLQQGTPPVLVRGKQGPVTFQLSDAPRGGGLGVEAVIAYPAMGLDIRMRPLGMLDGFRSATLVPPELRDKFLLQCEIAERRYSRPPLVEADFHRVLHGLAFADSIRMTDHHLAFHVALPDDPERLVKAAEFIAEKAKTIAALYPSLPFPAALEASRAAWEAAALERDGFLVPTVPQIVGMKMLVRTLGGEERTFWVRIGTEWAIVPHGYVEVSCPEAPMPAQAGEMLAARMPHPLLAPLHSTFTMSQEGHSAIRLHTKELVHDPRVLFPAVDALVSFMLDVRGERRVNAAYR